MRTEFTEQEIIRRNSLDELIRLGINPYPPECFDVNARSVDIRKNFPENNKHYQDISIAGRIMSDLRQRIYVDWYMNYKNRQKIISNIDKIYLD